MSPLQTRVQLGRAFHTTRAAPKDNVQAAARLTHIDDAGRPSMVDVSPKEPTKRTATARGRIYIPRVAYELVTGTEKGRRDDDAGAGPVQSGGSGDAGAAAALETARRKARAKGDVLTVAQLAAIMASKRTHELIPLCHPLQLSHVSVRLHTEVHAPSHLHPDRAPASSTSDSDAQAQEDTSAGAPPSDGALASGESPAVAYSVVCTATVTCEGKTGVEMEALTAVSVGLLTVWDMLKAVAGREMVISDVVVSEKRGGKSGDFRRGGEY